MRRKATLNPDAPLLHLEGHGKPVSRRDFLGRGLISGAALVMVPTGLQMLAARSAGAQVLDCGVGVAGGGKIPFIALDLRRYLLRAPVFKPRQSPVTGAGTG